MRGLDEDDEEPLDPGPTVIKKLDEELPATVVQFGDEPADVSDEGNGVEDQETDDDEDIPVAPMEVGEPSSTKKAGRASVAASRGSTPKTPKSVNKGAVSSAGRKRKADAIDEPAAKRPGRRRATAAAASEAIKTATAKRPRAAPGTKVYHVNTSADFRPSNLLKAPKTAGVKKAKPGPKPKKAAKEPAEEFEVEAIRDSKSDGKRGELFLVKWKGWTDKDNTWEPKENLAHAADILREYEATREETENEEEKVAPPKKAAGPKKTKAKNATKKVAPAKKAATAKPATTSRSRAGRPKRN